jgi:endogenous inhibitor of DNA gyrase (YacG/DUF329 family)
MQTDGTGIDLPFKPCPKCKKSVHTYFRFCPFCGTRLLTQLSEPSAQLGADALHNLFGILDPHAHYVGGLHQKAKDRLCEMGKQLGYQATSEYEIRPRSSRRKRLVDVVWFTGDHVIAAFEVRSKWANLGVALGHKDRDDLSELEAQVKFIVNVSRTTGKAYFHRLRDDSTLEYAAVSGEPYSYIEDVRRDYQKAFEAWTPEEDELLRKRFSEGIQISELAKIHQRTPWAVQMRLEGLGLLPPHSSRGRSG